MKTITLENGKKIQISEESYRNLQKSINVKKRYEPKQGDRYYYISDIGTVLSSIWKDDDRDIYRYLIKNIFKTKDEAEQKLYLIKRKYKIIKRIEELNEGWKPDWNDDEQRKYYIEYYPEHVDNDLDFMFNIENFTNLKDKSDKYYFKSKEIGEQLIEEFDDELEYLFIL